MQNEEGIEMLGSKKMNYEFLLLVRDKKYKEALILGKNILQVQPNNPSVKKFCDFILANNKELEEMMKEEKEEQQYEQVDSDEEDEESSSEGEEKSQSEKSSSEKESQEEEEEEEKEKPEVKKVELRTCTLNQIPHICTRDHH